jgi:hypothetical protein
MVRLLGADPDLDRIGATPDAFLMALYNFQCQPQPAVEQIAALCLPQRRPLSLAHLRLPAALPGPEECRQKLRAMVANVIDEIRSLEVELRMGKDRADLEFVLKKCLVLGEGESSRQFLRYHKEWSSTFFRFSQVLPVALERDASGFFDDLAASYDDDEPPPDPPVPSDPEPDSRADSDPHSTPADMRQAPPPPGAAMATPAAEAVAHPEAVAEELPVGDAPSGALPASAGLAVAGAAGAPERVAFPDPPSTPPIVPIPTEDRGALPASAGLAVAGAAGAPDRVVFPDPPSSAPAVTMQTEDDVGVKPHAPGSDGAAPPGQPVPTATELRPPGHQTWAVGRASPVPRGQEAAVRPIPVGLLAASDPRDRAPPAVRGAPESGDG